MVLTRSIAVAVAVTMFAGCSDEPTAPEGALVGTFGGRLIRVTSERDYVRIDLVCGFTAVVADAHMIPDSAGRFTLPEARGLWSYAAATTVQLSGVVSGDRIDATIRFVTGSTERIQTYTLIRGERADFSGIACALA